MNYIELSSSIYKMFECAYGNIKIETVSMGNVINIRIIEPKEIMFVAININPYEITILDHLTQQEHIVSKESEVSPAISNIMQINIDKLKSIDKGDL
jgi:hypothetical protein